MYCALKLGDICFIESLVGSLVASAILTAIVTGAIWLMNSDKRQEAKLQYDQARPRVLAAARRAFFDADHVKATELLMPLILQSDEEAGRIQEAINKRAEDISALGALVQEKKFIEAKPLLLQLSRNGEPDAQYLLGVLLAQSENQPAAHIEGIEWVAIAAARGSEGAKVQLERLLETVSPLEAYGIKERAQTWLRQYEVRKEVLAVDVNQK